MDTTTLHDAYGQVLEAAATVAASDTSVVPPPGEWDADQILAHLVVINAATLSTVSDVIAGNHTTYDNRVSQDSSTLARIIDMAGGNGGLRNRISAQGEALGLLAGPTLSERELDTWVPTRLVSNHTVLVDQPLSLRDILHGLADVELPGHAAQLRGLLPEAR